MTLPIRGGISILISFIVLCQGGSIARAAVLAEDDAGPENFCEQNGACTAEMSAITAAFSTAQTTFSQQPVSAFSGPCYHLDPNYDPQTKHYSAFTFKKAGEQLLADGLFFYFYSNDPYQGMTAPQVVAELEKASDGYAPTSLGSGSVLLNFRFDGSSSDYWFRSTPMGDQLFLIGRESGTTAGGAGYVTYVYCSLQAHLPN